MLHSDRLVLASVCALGLFGCTTEDPRAGTLDPDAGSLTPPDAGESGDAATENDDASSERTDGALPPPVFLEASKYEDLVTLDPSFPFGVTQRHAAAPPHFGTQWGRHGGPMVPSGDGSKVVQWSVTGEATAPATRVERPIASPGDLPKPFFYGAMTDLPFGPYALLSYTGNAPLFAGEALLYTAAYDRVTSRAKVNGFYSGAGVDTAVGPMLVFSALSPLTAAASSTSDNGLYAAPVCNGALAAAPPCAAPWRMFGWSGYAGPVVADGHGDVFVVASLDGGAATDAVYGFAKGQITPGAAVTPEAIAEVNRGGTVSAAAIAPDGDAPGWVVGRGYAKNDSMEPVYAASFVERGGSLVKSGPLVAKAVTPKEGSGELHVFADPRGALWLAVTRGKDGAYLELRRRTP